MVRTGSAKVPGILRIIHFLMWTTTFTRSAASAKCLVVSAFSSTSFHTSVKRPFVVVSSTSHYWWHRPIQQQQQQQKRLILMMTAVDNDDNTVGETTKSFTCTWNIASLKKEVQRLIQRSHKKVAKASIRLAQAQAHVEELRTQPEEITIEDLQACPNVEAVAMELNELQERLLKLNQLEGLLQTESKRTGILPEPTVTLALDLGVSDESTTKIPPRGPGKANGPQSTSKTRLPYRRYYSHNNIEIRVGKKAEDNDELSCLPKHRDGPDWWMHASGCPGSHIVIRCHDDNLHPEVVQDAAALAARQSKCTGNTIQVSLTRCRDVKKPPGAKAGLVQLTGKVRTISVQRKEAEVRLKRLDDTVIIN